MVFGNIVFMVKKKSHSVLQHLVQSEVRDYSSMEERRSETPTMLASGKFYIPAPGAVWGAGLQ